MSAGRHAWIDASAGVAGDMLLGALVDAGAELASVQRAVDAVLPGSIQLTATTVTRAGLRALKVDAQPLVADPPHRTWHGIRELLAQADLDGRVHDRAGAVFARLADAEARVHGIPVDDVHFHEVGALDSIADVVGVCAALEELDVATVSAGEVAVGSGRVRSGHGDLPVPVPAVAELARGWRVRAGGTGELATPTGMAAIRALATSCEDLPAMAVEEVGSGAGGRDNPGRANVVRVLVGVLTAAEPAEPMMMLETNVDDLDPRLWPGVLAGLLADGAADAWLVPIVMKKGRPAHTLSVLCRPQRAGVLRERMLRDTSTLGVREQLLHRYAVPRTFVDIELDGGTIAVKVAHRDGVITQVMPEFDDVAAAARRLERPERLVLQQATAAATAAGLVVGAAYHDSREYRAGVF
ncbi:nickel pincer cofactor biosynthesis protein LarC [Actinoplanes sp. CA-051413]|uniref:nickel pincer cofactor biosynthesis protein LarC n=1 Tax=Actinoplanes sp. CA-051413 TaxID=3239899 RepID=UPI003D953B3A